MVAQGKAGNAISKLAVAVGAIIVYNIVITAIVGYGAYYTLNRLSHLSQANNVFRQQVNDLMLAQSQQDLDDLPDMKSDILIRKKRIIYHVRGGTPIRAEDFDKKPREEMIKSSAGSARAALTTQSPELLIVEDLLKEWKNFSSSFGGSTYVRWGQAVCPATSQLIYTGQMAGADRRSSGGGSNYQCMPANPEYNTNENLSASYSDLVYTQYAVDKGASNGHMVPCVVCEANQRVSKLMIPAAVRCPAADWVLEYKGHLFSAPTGSSKEPITKGYNRDTYECIDDAEQSLTGEKAPNHWHGARIHRVKARCDGNGAFVKGCPPYQANRPLSCVVCTK